jgi:hypothetical protein
MNQEMDWEEYEKIIMQRPGFKKALADTLLEYEIARTKIKTRVRGLLVDAKNRKLADISLDLARGHNVSQLPRPEGRGLPAIARVTVD